MLTLKYSEREYYNVHSLCVITKKKFWIQRNNNAPIFITIKIVCRFIKNNEVLVGINYNESIQVY